MEGVAQTVCSNKTLEQFLTKIEVFCAKVLGVFFPKQYLPSLSTQTRERVMNSHKKNSLAPILLTGLLIGSSSLLAGCTTKSVIHTKPSGADVFLNTRYLGKSPAKAKLTDGYLDGSSYSVKLEMEGYRTQTVHLEQRPAAGYIVLDALFCLPTFGITCYLFAVNGRKHKHNYEFVLFEEK